MELPQPRDDLRLLLEMIHRLRVIARQGVEREDGLFLTPRRH